MIRRWPVRTSIPMNVGKPFEYGEVPPKDVSFETLDLLTGYDARRRTGLPVPVLVIGDVCLNWYVLRDILKEMEWMVRNEETE